jgi:hypothetical protein
MVCSTSTKKDFKVSYVLSDGNKKRQHVKGTKWMRQLARKLRQLVVEIEDLSSPIAR